MLHFKFIKILVLFFVVVAVLPSCKRKKHYVVAGTLYEACGKPAANFKLELRQSSTRFYNSTGGRLDVTKTDSKGQFRFEYKAVEHGETPLSLFSSTDPLSYLIMDSIPANQALNFEAYLYQDINIKVNFKTPGDTTLIAFDTVFVGITDTFVGPFTSGIQSRTIKRPVDVKHYGYTDDIYKMCWGRGFLEMIKSAQSLNHYHE